MNHFVLFSGKLTCYGYPGDSTPDKNSENAIGAWDNTLHDQVSLAVSPDVVAAFKANGIHPLGEVEVHLVDGTILHLRWADKTANDEQAAKLGLHPLRGRFDLYCAHKKSPLDGFHVNGFRRIAPV